MQCPSPYWSTPLTPEDRRINSKNLKTFSLRKKLVQINFLGQKTTFYPEITKNLMFEKCEFLGKMRL